MLAHSTALRDVLLSGNIVATCRATVQRAGEVLVPPEELLLERTPTVTLDESAPSVRTLSATIIDPDGKLRPRLATDALAPYGSELVLETGVLLPTGVYEWVPAGVYRLEIAKGSTGRTVAVNGLDRSVVVARARNESPYVVAGGNLADQIEAYLHAKFPGVPFLADPDAYGIGLVGGPRIYQEGSTDGDPWQNMRALAATFGYRLTFDAFGTAVLAKIPDPAEQVVTWRYEAGEANLAVSGDTNLDTTGLYNVWVVSGQGSGIDPPVRAVVEVTDPASPIYAGAGSTFGRRPTFYQSSFLTTADQCRAAGEGFMANQNGAADSVSFTAVANCLHEPGDLVSYASPLLDVNERLLLSRWSLAADLSAPSHYETRSVAA